MEIERKWLLKEVPQGLKQLKHYLVEQSYVMTGDVEIRIRKRTPAPDFVPLKPRDFVQYYLTFKSTGDLARQEEETPITEIFYEGLKKNFVGGIPPIKKDFYVFELADGHILHCARVDDSWVYCEVEFETEEEANAYELPIPYEEEITYDKSYKMQSYWTQSRPFVRKD